jgi:hypothetical protein
MGMWAVRPGIPLSFGAEAREEALAIRNQLLVFRFRRKGRHEATPDLSNAGIEPRLAQILSPLLSVVSDQSSRDEIRDLALEYNRELVAQRGLDLEGLVLEAIKTLRDTAPDENLTIKAIADLMADRHGDEFDRKLTPRWIGHVIHQKLGLKTEKRHGNFEIAAEETPKLRVLFEKYGVEAESGDIGDFGDIGRREDKSDASTGQAL